MEMAMSTRVIDGDLLFVDRVAELIPIDFVKKYPDEVDVISSVKHEHVEDVDVLYSSDEDELFIDCVNEIPWVFFSDKFNHGEEAISEIDYEHIEACQVSGSSSTTEIRYNTSFSEFGELAADGIPEEEISSLNSELTKNRNTRLGNSPTPISEKDGGDVNVIESGFLDHIGELLMQAAVFQLDLIICLVSSPSTSLHLLDEFLKNPLGTMISGRDYFLKKSGEFRDFILQKLSFSVSSDLKEENGSVLKISFGLSKALFLSVFACVFMACLLVISFVLSYLTARIVVVEPVQIKEELYFDFTQSNPVAFVPVVSSRVISPHERFLVTISILLPESEHNRNLGVFQTKVDQMGVDGKVIATTSRPCMLPYRSEGIRVISSSLRILPVLAGRAVESQTVNLRFAEFSEGVRVPTASMRVTMEPRAEVRAGGGDGIPEIYAAYFSMESHLPFFQRMMWQWRTVFLISAAALYFSMGALLTLISSLPLLLPKLRSSSRSCPPRARFVPSTLSFHL